MMKMEIRSATISYSNRKSKSIRNREQDIIQKLNLLDDAICNNFSSPDIAGVLQEYDQLKAELKSIYEEKGKQAMFRAKCRWVENGERPTKYFLNLEKRNYNKKTISELRLQDESTTNNANVILVQIETFYKNLYASEGTFSDEECDIFTRNLELPKLSDEDRDSLEGQLTYDECKKVLETLQNDKAPGEDGFTVEFYKYFFELIGNDLLASFNEAHMKGELCISQRKTQNAKRFESILPLLIHSDQTGFVKGRYIGENIRLINDIMETTKSQNLPGILTSLDFRKAFDSLEWPFITKTLDYFNFGSDIKRWVSTFYTNIESTVVNNGYTTNWFKPYKGVRQGCSLSPYLFILSAELLSNKIRQDSTLKGIKVFGNEIKLSQFADDTTLFNADLASLEKALWNSRWFWETSWSILKCEKNEGYLAGTMGK